MRVCSNITDEWFASWQWQLAEGIFNNENDDIVIPEQFRCFPNSIHTLIEHAYPDIYNTHSNNYFREHCILCPRNRDAHQINELLLD